MKKILGMLVLVLTSAPAFAADYKIGFVTTERIFREAAPAVKALKKIEKEFAPREAELQKLAKRAKDLQASMGKTGATSEADRRNKEQEIARINRDFPRLQQQFQEDLNNRKNEELAGIMERANRVIRQIAESEKYDLILQDAVYRSPAIDITDKVLKALVE